MLDRMNVLLGAVLLALPACGNGDNGNQDTLLTGFSGLVIAVIVIWLLVRAIRKRS